MIDFAYQDCSGHFSRLAYNVWRYGQ